jgi:hypothetical protein
MNQAAAPAAVNSRCAKCGAEFRCGMEAGDPECWCASLPPLMPLPLPLPSDPDVVGCFCAACLKSALGSSTGV